MPAARAQAACPVPRGSTLSHSWAPALPDCHAVLGDLCYISTVVHGGLPILISSDKKIERLDTDDLDEIEKIAN